jgi:hypothetical protein
MNTDMKKIIYMFGLLACCALGACNDDALDPLTGQYDMDSYVFTRVSSQSTTKLGKGVKSLGITVTDESGHTMDLKVGSLEWTLQNGVYSLASGSLTNGTYQGNIDNTAITAGTLEVTLIEETYYLVGLFTGADGHTYRCNYKGSIDFEIGEDDPEAGDYTATLDLQMVTETDASGNFVGFVSGLQKYAFTLKDGNGATTAYLELVNAEGLSGAQLAGSYTVDASAITPLTLSVGNALPAEWGGYAWGSYFVNNGVNQYLQSGSVNVTVAFSAEGEALYTFTAEGLGTTLGMDAATFGQIAGTGNAFTYKFVPIITNN